MNELLAGAIAAYVYLTQVQGVTPEAFEYENLACTATPRQSNEVYIGCGYIQVDKLPNTFDQFDSITGVMRFGRNVQQLGPTDGGPEPWAVALRLLQAIRCSQWQGNYWKCQAGPPDPLGIRGQ